MLYIGGDHAGYKLKEQIKKYLDGKGIDYEDLGPRELLSTDDYPDYAARVAKAVLKNSGNQGILICGSAAGVCVAANKFKGIRATVAGDRNEAKKTREHNDANILCLSGWKLDRQRAVKILKAFLETPFSGEERHIRRLSKIRKIEEETMK